MKHYKIKTIKELVFVPDVVGVAEDEGFVDVEAARDDVFCVLEGQALAFVEGEIFPEKLFVVGQLNDERNVERILQPPASRKPHD